MTGEYARAAVARYILNIIDARASCPLAAWTIIEWAEALGRDLLGDTQVKKTMSRQEKAEAVVSQLNRIIRQNRKKADTIQASVMRLSGILQYDETDTQLLLLAARLNSSQSFGNLMGNVVDGCARTTMEIFATMLQLPVHQIGERLAPSGKLFQTGVVMPNEFAVRRNGYRYDPVIQVSPDVFKALQMQHGSDSSLIRHIVGESAQASLSPDDFDYIRPTFEFICKLLRSAVLKRAKGINILLYGIPGTGKTEICKTIANELKHSLYPIAEKQDNGAEPERGERVRRLCTTNALLRSNKRTLLLFDEMEDIAAQNPFQKREGSKVFLNRVLEENRVPTFWTANDIRSIDKSILRRMTLSIEMKPAPLANRSRVLKRILKEEKLNLRDDEIETLSRDFDDPPALLKNAIRAATLAHGGKEQVKFVLQSARKAMGHRNPGGSSSDRLSAFLPQLVNANVDLDDLTRKLAVKGGVRQFSLCLYGPPGTGKSAWVRHLAGKMGMEVTHLRASDLISMWVGETERKIAEAFEKAKADETFLIFDEADSFLHNRQLSRNSWEITAVNEMLTWMESHPLPFACTTNLMERLDAASLRRFTFKFCFDFMAPEQAAACFRHFFSIEPPLGVRFSDRLTPGDFAVVKHKAKIVGQDKDPQAILAMLQQECDAKLGDSRSIGFLAPI